MIDVYQTVTDRILKQLEASVVPWRKTWTTGLPKSLTSAREYRGINVVLLALSSYSSRYWVTYGEAARLGGHVRKGEKATPVYFWHWRTEEDLAKLRQKAGRDNFAPCTCFISYAFNLEQVEGLDRPADDFPGRENRPLELAEQLLEVMPDKPEIIHSRTVSPRYSRALDRVMLPHLSQFESAAEFYGTLFHELVHSTGHDRRLDRAQEAEGDTIERYSFEELVAELGASFLCSFAGIRDPKREALSAGYIDGWAAVFRKDNRLLMRAASAAQRAADYIRGKIVVDSAAAPRETTLPVGSLTEDVAA